MKWVDDIVIPDKKLALKLGVLRSGKLYDMVTKFYDQNIWTYDEDNGSVYFHDYLMGVYEVKTNEVGDFLRVWLEDWVKSTAGDYKDPDKEYRCHVELETTKMYSPFTWKLSLTAEGCDTEVLEALFPVEPEYGVWPPKQGKRKATVMSDLTLFAKGYQWGAMAELPNGKKIPILTTNGHDPNQTPPWEKDDKEFEKWYDQALEEAHRQNYFLEGELSGGGYLPDEEDE